MENVNKKQNIDESFIENALLVAGFVPIIGEAADTALILKYAYEKRYIEAGLMMIALIPTVGDILVKPFLFMAKGSLKSSKLFFSFLSKNKKAMSMFKKMEPYVVDGRLKKLVDQVTKRSPVLGKTLKGLQTYMTKLFSHASAEGAAKAGGKVAGNATKIGKAVKGHFQNKALRKYLAKHPNTPPSTVLSHWWNVVYKGNRMRKNYVTKLLLGNGVLRSLGIFNIDDLQEMISKDPEKLMNDPAFNDFTNKVTQDGDENKMEQTNDGENSNNESNDGGGVLSMLGGIGTGSAAIGILKNIARFV